MDYSSINDDGDLHHGSSPWSSSPQHSKSFSRSSIDRTSSPTPGSLNSSTTLGGPGYDESSTNDTGDEADVAPVPISRDEAGQSTLPDRSAPERNSQEEPQAGRPASNDVDASRKQGKKPAGPPKPRYTLTAKVNGLERSGRKDPMVRFDVHTNLPAFRTTQFRDVRRSHGEFKNLAEHLVSANPEAIVPALPPASTAAGVGTDEDDAKVKTNMQRWLNYVCSSEVLMRDEEMIRFVEGDPGYSPVIRMSQPATGMRRKVLKQFAPPPDDTPELQEARPVVKRFYLGTMEAEQKLEKMVKLRRALGLAELEFAQKLTAASEQELHPGLKNAYRKLGRTVQTIADLHAAQGTAEASTLGDQLAYHSADAFVVKETLTNRHILLRELLQAQQTTRSKLNASERLKSSTKVRRDKVDEAIGALDEARTHETYLHQKTSKVTANLLQDQRTWFDRSSTDLLGSMREYVVREIESERRCLAILESVRPDIRAIDQSGGLSRLGREATLAARRAHIASSQGPKGDAWSGDPRRQGDGLNRSLSGSFSASAQSEGDDDADGGGGGASSSAAGRKRAVSGTESLASVKEDDDDRVDARNAASRLAASTF